MSDEQNKADWNFLFNLVFVGIPALAFYVQLFVFLYRHIFIEWK